MVSIKFIVIITTTVIMLSGIFNIFKAWYYPKLYKEDSQGYPSFFEFMVSIGLVRWWMKPLRRFYNSPKWSTLTRIKGIVLIAVAVVLIVVSIIVSLSEYSEYFDYKW